VNHFGPENLKELLEEDRSPAVSIYMPVALSAAAAEADVLRFRAALNSIRKLLASNGHEAGPSILADLEALKDDSEFWRGGGGSLAVFAAQGFRRTYRLPAEFEEFTSVGPVFHTRPMVEYLQAPGRYWLLSLSQKDVQLWQGSGGGLTRFESNRLPKSLEDALGRQVVPEKINYHSTGSHGGAPVYHGHGVGKDDVKPELERFFRLVDAVLAELLQGQLDPVVLAAVDYYHPIYRSVSKLGTLAEDGIHGSVTDWDAERLHRAAWPIARRRAEGWIHEALELWEQSYGRGKAEPDLATAFRLGVAGRIRALLTERSRLIWGEVDRSTGEIAVLGENGEDPDTRAADLLNELAGLTIRHGGKTLVLPAERMPTQTGLAAILR
jgi:hypothetical protein